MNASGLLVTGEGANTVLAGVLRGCGRQKVRGGCAQGVLASQGLICPHMISYMLELRAARAYTIWCNQSCNVPARWDAHHRPCAVIGKKWVFQRQ